MSAGGKSSVAGQSRVTLNGVEVHPTTLQPLTAVPLGQMRPLAAPVKAEPVRPIGEHFAAFAYHYLTGRHRPGNLMGEMGTGALIAVFWSAGNDIEGATPEAKHAKAIQLLHANGKFEYDATADAWSVKQA